MGCMGFVWEHADSFLRCVASPFHSFVTSIQCTVPLFLKMHHDGRATRLRRELESVEGA